MHTSAFEKIRAFRNGYLAGGDNKPIRVLEVGSASGPGWLNCHALFDDPSFEYVGLDLAEGHNVDLVPEDPYSWGAIASESFDVVVSNQTFEHIPYFWITAAEISRVLRQGGLVVVVSPSAGAVHRFPLDCWRFYPDSWSALCKYVGLELLESYREKVSWRKVSVGVYWRDAMMVARKPQFEDEASRSHFYKRLDAIVDTRTEAPEPLVGVRLWGNASTAYERVHTLPVGRAASNPLALLELSRRRVQRLWARSPGGIALRKIRARDDRASLQRGEALLPWPNHGPVDRDVAGGP